jgi:hypothetical protein
MAFGDFRDDEALRAAWKQFCRRLEDAGEQVFKDSNPATSVTRADGFRYLMQNLGQSWMLGYETKDTRYPIIFTFESPFCKLGGDNADSIYQQAWIDGQSVYRITGTRGSAAFLNILVQGPRPELQPGTDWPSLHEPYGDIPEAGIHGYQLKTDWDGTFELYVGGPERGPNWLPTTPGSRKMFIRQIFDKWDETPGVFRIERIDMSEPRPVPTPADIVAGLDWAGKFVFAVTNDWPEFTYLYMPGHYDKFINQFPPDDGDQARFTDRMRGRNVQMMLWRLAPDEAMIVEMDDQDGLWMFTNMGVYDNSMDFLYRPVSYTPSRTKVDSDGKVRLIMCHDDPGFHNWLDTQGSEQGNLAYRKFLTAARGELTTRVVKRDQLASELPADTAKVTPEERAKQMWDRFNGIRRRFIH